MKLKKDLKTNENKLQLVMGGKNDDEKGKKNIFEFYNDDGKSLKEIMKNLFKQKYKKN